MNSVRRRRGKPDDGSVSRRNAQAGAFPGGRDRTLALLAGTLALLGGITAALTAGNPELIAKAGAAATLDWHGLLAGSAQITAAGGLIGFGVVLAWMFAREFTDGTITGIFGLPVSRARIASAKFIVYALWVVFISLALGLSLLVMGLMVGYGNPSAQVMQGLGRQVVLTVLTGVVAVPVAWVASITRSLLAAVAAAIGLVILAQVGALAGIGGWMPLAAPALWAMSAGAAVSLWQLATTVVFALLFVMLTCLTWARLQLDR